MGRRQSGLNPYPPAVGDWFRGTLGEPTSVQTQGWAAINKGHSALLVAPTGSGKTLAAFLDAIARLAFSDEPDKKSRCRILYVSPLKALAVDVERNLRAPLLGILETAKARGDSVRPLQVWVRTGDTPAAERARMHRAPPDILITTPESLYLLLTSNAESILQHIETVIVDEVHQLVPTKRGAHLALTLERLEAIRVVKKPLQRIGLSATVRPLDEVARYLGGVHHGKPRPVTIVDTAERRELTIKVDVPAVDMARIGERLDDVPTGPAAGEPPRRSIWPEVHARIVELVRAHRSTMIFVNSRRLAERLAGALNELAGEEIALAHHGSVAKEKRVDIEDRLKQGVLPAIVATSSLELGIDMGAVDLVIQVEAPPSVAAGMQRIGRANHSVRGTPSGVLVPKHRGDLLACAAAAIEIRAGEVEPMAYPRSALDILAQQIVAIVAKRETTERDLLRLVRRAAPFAELPQSAFVGVLDMLSGRYPSEDFSELRPRITWDRTSGRITARQGVLRLAVLNGGTIPDRGLYGVFLAGEGKSGRRVGELDEEMVFELREGEVFHLGASSWRTEEITVDRVLVSPAPGQPGKMPFWHGDRPGRPRPFGMAVGALAASVHKEPSKAAARLKKAGLNEHATRNLVEYIRAQGEATGEVPGRDVIVIERFLDEIGDYRVCVLSPLGMNVHAPWGAAVLAKLRATWAGELEGVWSDDGMVFRVPFASEPPSADLFLPSSEEVERVLTDEIAGTSLFAARFRENAARALLLPKHRPGKRTPLWAQRKRAADLLSVASQHPSFPILLETYRECLRDVFDLPGLLEVLRNIESRRMRVVVADTVRPSPFATQLMFGFSANFIYEGDAPIAERRVAALGIDHAQLAELLGEAEIRKLIDPGAMDAYEASLQGFEHPVAHADAVHDLLLRLGDLSEKEIAARAQDQDPQPWIAELVAARRIVPVRMGKKARLVAVEDAARYRDALGVALPMGIPGALLAPAADALGDLLKRYARTHAPFTAVDVAKRWSLGVDTVARSLDALVRQGRIVRGAFRPQGNDAEYCDAEVLRALKRKSLAKLRAEVEPVPSADYARFLAAWQGLGRPRRGIDGLLHVVAQLQGYPILASELESRILPARVEDYAPWMLDLLCSRGEVTWAGIDAQGPHDGRIALYLAESDALLARPGAKPESALHESIRRVLRERGAVFFADLTQRVDGYPPDILHALWDLVWAGEVTNDTLAPLRSLAKDARERGRPTLRLRSRAPQGSEGRWSLRDTRWSSRPSDTERATALAGAMLERYGVVVRECTAPEQVPGGFSFVYPVLSAMEHAGRIRRGYFVAGRGAAQFALPGAEDRLRRIRESEAETLVLASTDPANPYGSILPWPDQGESKSPRRAAGTSVIVAGGELLAHTSRDNQRVTTFLPEAEPQRTSALTTIATALSRAVEGGKKRAQLVSTVDDAPAVSSVLGPALRAAGFTARTDGSMQLRARPDEERLHARG